MSKDWVADIHEMQKKYGFYDVSDKLEGERLAAHFDLRMSMHAEEQNELNDAGTAEDIVDAIIDQMVFCIGTLLLFGVDPYKAWDAVLEANMNKTPGVKPGRPNPLGLPDLIKPADWKAPSHEGNHGRFEEALWPECDPPQAN